MKVLLRSAILCAQSDDYEKTYENYLDLSSSDLPFDHAEDSQIWEFVKEFSQTHNHSPELRTVRSHFEKEKKNEVLDRLETLHTLKPIYRGDFRVRLEERSNERRETLTRNILSEAADILKTGIKVRQGKEEKILKGPLDAIHHILTRSHDVITPTTGTRLSGEVVGDGEDFLKDTIRRMQDPLAGSGQYTGIRQMDEALKGAKKFELWTHAAFTGGLKSTFALNWMYNQAVYMDYSSTIFSLEMPYAQVRRILYAMHSYHGKFKEARLHYGIQKDDFTKGLDYSKIRDGLLTQDEFEFLSKYVVEDFRTAGYGHINVEVSDPSRSEYGLADIQSRSELLFSKNPFQTLLIDHGGLVSARKWVPSPTDRLNEVLRDSKRLAMNFHRGEGMAVVVLFQISREGYKSAEKSVKAGTTPYTEGPYNLTHLSYANEAERSSDIVTASWVDKVLMSQNKVLFQNLKSRDDRPFDNFFAHVDWPTRRILTTEEIPVFNVETGKEKQVVPHSATRKGRQGLDANMIREIQALLEK